MKNSKNKWKQWLAITLSLIMFVGMIPCGHLVAAADEVGDVIVEEDPIKNDLDEIYEEREESIHWGLTLMREGTKC